MGRGLDQGCMKGRKEGRKGRGEDGVGLLVLVVLTLMMIIRYFRCTTTTTTTTSTLRFLCEERSSMYVYVYMSGRRYAYAVQWKLEIMP